MRWRTFKRESPYLPLHVGYLGKVPVASISDEGKPFISKGFDLHFSLPPKDWRDWSDHSTLYGHVSSFSQLAFAKMTAERVVDKWLKDAGLALKEKT